MVMVLIDGNESCRSDHRSWKSIRFLIKRSNSQNLSNPMAFVIAIRTIYQKWVVNGYFPLKIDADHFSSASFNPWEPLIAHRSYASNYIVHAFFATYGTSIAEKSIKLLKQPDGPFSRWIRYRALIDTDRFREKTIACLGSVWYMKHWIVM